MISFNKITSIIVAACFVFTSIGGQAAASVAANMRATEQYKQIFSDFMLPYSYGKITDAHFASTDRVIINIQDLHCHPKVQKNISNIIDLFDKRYGVKTVYLEGAYGDVDTSWITGIVDSNYKNKLLDKMIETGRLTGAEYYSALRGKTNIIKGLEKKEPYLENLKRFGEILENKDKINVILESVAKSGDELRTKYYDRRQLKIEELSKQYELGKITAEKYYILLAKHIDRLGIDITGYENTLNYMTLMEMQKHLKYGEITNQLQTLVLTLKGTLPAGAYKMLLDSTGNLSQIDKLYGCLIKITRQYNLDMSVNYPELNKYFAYIELSQKINPLGLLEENKKLTEEINSRFSNTKAQSEVVFLVNFERYLKDYLTSKITSADYEYYKNNIEIYKKLWAKYVDNKVLSLLDVYISQADKFYAVNTDRNGYFTENIFNEVLVSTITPSVQSGDETAKVIENMSQTKRVDIIITGGFHTGTVSEILKNHNVSYIVITPNVTDGLKTAEETYYKIAKEQSKISFQTLANLIASLSPVEQKRVLIAADPSLESKLGFIPVTQESVLSQEQIKQLAEIVKMSEVLLSDDKGEIKQQIIQNIKDRLESSDPELVKETDEELIKYVDMDKLKTAFENTQELKRLIEHAVKIKTAANASFAGQSFAAIEDLASKITLAIEMLQGINLLSKEFTKSKIPENTTEVKRENIISVISKIFPEYQKFFTDEDINYLITYSIDFFNGFPDEKVFEKNTEELILSILDPDSLAIAIRPFRPAYLPRINPPDALRKQWFKEIAEECAKYQKDYLNKMRPDIRNKFFAAKLLRGANLTNITQYLRGLKKSGLLSNVEKAFLDTISLDSDIGKQLVIEEVVDYSSSRIANEGNIVLRVTLKNLSGNTITFFIKGLDKDYKIPNRKNAKYHFYENTFYWVAGILGLHSIYIDFYSTPDDRYTQGYSIMQVIPGEDTSRLFDMQKNGSSHFKIKDKYKNQKDNLIASFAVFAALTDLLGRGDSKIIKTHHPMFSANYMFDVLENGEIKIYPIDATLLFNPDNSHVIKTMREFGDLELGIILAFYEDKNGLDEMLEIYRKEYLETWKKIKDNAKQMKEYILSVYGEDSWEYPIFLSAIDKDPELLFEQQKQALLEYISANAGQYLGSISEGKPNGEELKDSETVQTAKPALQEQSTGESSVFQPQHKKNSLMRNITKKILPFILAITILFTGFLNIGRYGRQPSATAETQTVAVSETVAPAVMDSQLYENNRFLFNYLRNNQSLFAPSDISFLNASVELSNGSEAKELVKQIYKTLGIGAETGSAPEILFLTGSNAPLYSACACSDINVIIIPVGADLKLPLAGEMAAKVAHENTHIKNHQKVISGEMSQLEDETMATEAGIVADETYEKNLVIESMFNGTASVNNVTAMPLFGFYSILENQETVVKKFIEITGDKNITFNDIYYSGVFFGSQNKAELPAEVKIDSLGENEVAIRLYYGNTSIMYVVKVDGSRYSLSKIEVFSDNLYVQADKVQISDKISLYYSPNPVFGAEDVINSLDILSVSEALLKSKDINLETLQFISFYFPYEREDDGDSDIIRFIVRDEKGIFYGIDLKKDVGIIKITNNATGEEVWKAKEGFSKDIISPETSQQSGQRTGTLGTSVTIESSRPEKSAYSKIYKLSVNKLKAFVQNENNGISERFLAFLILKNKGINIQIPEEMLAAGKQYLRDIESGKISIITAEEIKNNKYKTADDRLKSALAAVYYIMLNSYINDFNIEQTVLDKIWKDIYEKAGVAFSNSGGADSSLSFQPDSLTSDIMAHELLHNITDVYLGAGKNLTSSAFAEFSSDIAKIVLCQQLGIDIPSDLKDRYKEYAAYIKAGAVPLEEHYLARGIIGLIMEVSADAGRNVNWNNMMSAVSQCLQNADFVNLINSNNFNKVFASVLEKYLEIETGRTVEGVEASSEQTSELYDNIVKLLTPQLTMTWLSKLLDLFKITDFERRQNLINAIENPIIMLGLFIPAILKWFIKQHKGQSEEAVKEGINKILMKAGLITADCIPAMGIITMFVNGAARFELNKAHTNWNLLKILEPAVDIDNQKLEYFLRNGNNNYLILKIISATKGLPDAVLQYVLEEVAEYEKFDYYKFIEVLKKIKKYDAETLDFVSLYLITDKTSDKVIFEFYALNEESKSLIIKYGINKYNKDWEEDNLILAINVLKDYENFEYSETEIKFLLKLIFASSAQNITRLNKKPNKRILNTVLNNIQLLNTSNRPYVDGGLILGLIFCDFNMLQNDVNRMASLIEQLAVRKITGLAIENEALAIKIFLNSSFQKSLNDKGITDIVMQYKIAIKLSRSIYSNIGENAVNLSEYRLERMIEAALESHCRITEIAGNADVLSDEIGVFGFYNNEELKNREGRRFTPKGISKIIELLEINPKRQIHLEIEAGQNPKKKAEEFLSYIRNFGSIKKQYGLKGGFFIFEGHGSSDGFYYDEDNFISVEDITKALEEAYNSGVDLEEITIDLSCCHSYYFANKIIRSLKSKNIEKYPQILTDAGYETVYAYDDYIGLDETQSVSNLYFGIIGYLQNKKIIGQSIKGRLSLRNIFELDLYLSDHTVFITNDDIKEENDRLKEKLQKILEEKDFPDIKTEEIDDGIIRFNPAIINAGFIKAIPNVQFDAIQELKFVMDAQKSINIDLLNVAFENNLKKFNLINFVKERISGIVRNIIKKVEKVKEYTAKLNNKIADIAKIFNIFSQVFERKNESQNLLQIRSPILDSRMSELTMTWLSKKLDKKGITGQERADIINRKENIWIVLGVIFPNSIGRIFAYLHLTKKEKSDKTAKETKINSVREAMKVVADQVGLTVPAGNFIRKLIAGIIFYISNKDILSAAHTDWNNGIAMSEFVPDSEKISILLEMNNFIIYMDVDKSGNSKIVYVDAEIEPDYRDYSKMHEELKIPFDIKINYDEKRHVWNCLAIKNQYYKNNIKVRFGYSNKTENLRQKGLIIGKSSIPSTLQNKRTVEKLNKIGNAKFIKWVYGNNINKTGENFRYTSFGVAIGVILETFSLWSPNFIKSHDNPTMGMKITVWVIRALSIGIGVTVALSPVSPLLIAPAVILAEWITHFIWNKAQISNNDFLSDDSTSAVTEKQVNFYKKLKNKPLEEVISKINMRDGLDTDENDEHFIRLKKKTARLLKAYIERQFKKKEKGITELISNALDAGEDNIDVSVEKGRITVENDGKEGISLETVFDNLLNITNSTKTERRVQIGRFGLGFFSSLNYLENEDDELSIVSLRSDTCFRVTIGVKYEDGIKKYYIKDVESLTRQEAGRFARHLKGNGTSINMKIKTLEKQEEADNIIKGIKYDFSHSLKKIKLYHGGGYDVLGYNENSFKKLEREPDTEAGLLFNPQKALPGAGRIIVVIKGVKFFELKVLGSNISKEMIVDLPNSLNFSISRDSITVDSELEINIAELIDNIAYGSLPFKDKIMLLNSLYPLCQHFEIQKPGFVNAVEIKKITRELIKREIELAEKEGRTLFVCRDIVENYEFFGADNPEVVFVNMNLMPKELYYTNNVKITVIKNPSYPAEKTRLIIRHFANNTDYSSAGEKGEFSKKELIGIGEDNEIIFINSGERGFFEKNKYVIPYSMNPVIREIEDGRYRTRMHESAKFPGQEYWYGSMEDLLEEINGGKKDESKVEERDGETEYFDTGYFDAKRKTRGTVADLMMSRYSIARPKAAMIQNELRQTIHDLSQTGGMFVTELIQNACESGASSLEIKFDEKQGIFAISDNGNGMSYDTIINELLLPNSSSKEGLNVFGTGIFSVFRENVRRVSVMTSTEKGTHVIELMPICDGNGFVVNVEYVIYTLETARPKGTTITVFGNGASSLFKNKYISDAVSRQAGLLPKDNIEVIINGEKFNDFMDEKIFAKPVGEDSDFSIYNIGGGKSFLSVNNRFVRELDFNFLFELGINKDHLLFEALKYLIDSGIILKFPDNTEILFNKQDVKVSDKQKKQIIDYLFASFVQLYMHDAGASNSTIIPEIPYDYLKNGGPGTPFLKKLNRFQITSKGYNVETVMAFLKAFSWDFAGSAEFIKEGNLTALQDFIIEMCMFAGESEESAEEKSWEMIAEIIADMNDGKTEDIIDVMKNFRGEILSRALRIIMTEEEIKTYEIEKIGAAIMKSNDISVQGRFKYEGYCCGKTAGYFINSLRVLSNKEAQTDRNDKIRAPSAVDNKPKQPKQNKENVTINGKPLSSSPELSYMYDVIRALLDALIEAYGYDNNINLDFVFDLSNDAVAYAEGNTIAMNIAALRDLVGSLKDSNHDLFSETLALLFHEFTHIVENEEDGTHNKIFYDLERNIMYKFLTDAEALEKLEKTINGVEREYTVKRKLFESFRNVVIQIWERTAYAEYLKKNPDVLKEEQGLKYLIKDYIEEPVAAVSFADYKKQAAAKLSRNAAEDGNENLKAGKQMTSVRILNAIGNMKFIKWLYGNKAEKTGENFRYTVLGVAIGVILETFVLWRSDFINLHENPTFEMKIGVWLIRAITIILGVTTAFSSPISPLVAIPVFIMTEWISHFIWNRSQISNKTPEHMLQTSKSAYGLIITLLEEIFKVFMLNAGNIFEKNKIMQIALLMFSSLNMKHDVKLPADVYRAVINAFNGVFSKKDHKIIHRYIQGEPDLKTKEQLEDLEVLKETRSKLSENINSLQNEKSKAKKIKEDKIAQEKTAADELRAQQNTVADKKSITEQFKKIENDIESEYQVLETEIQNEISRLNAQKNEIDQKIDSKKDALKFLEERNKREKIIKMFSFLYAYQTFFQFKNNPKNKKYIDKNGNIQIYGYKLTLEQWIHICDGHSVFTNGNEIDGLDRYPSSETALENVITLDFLISHMESILTNPDVFARRKAKNSSILYIKREPDHTESGKVTEKVCVLVVTANHEITTSYIIDTAKYEANPVYNIFHEISTELVDKNSGKFNEERIFRDIINEEYEIEIWHNGDFIRGSKSEYGSPFPYYKRHHEKHAYGRPRVEQNQHSYQRKSDWKLQKVFFLENNSIRYYDSPFIKRSGKGAAVRELENIYLEYRQNFNVYNKTGGLKPITSTLQNKSTVDKLNKIGNGKFIQWLYGNNINKTGENFRYTVLGVAIGVVLETFSLWTPNFIKSHDNPTMGMKIAVWVIRALSIGIGVTVALNPVTLPFIIPAVILTEWITHFIWNKVQISKGNKEQILQNGKQQYANSDYFAKLAQAVNFDDLLIDIEKAIPFITQAQKINFKNDIVRFSMLSSYTHNLTLDDLISLYETGDFFVDENDKQVKEAMESMQRKEGRELTPEEIKELIKKIKQFKHETLSHIEELRVLARLYALKTYNEVKAKNGKISLEAWIHICEGHMRGFNQRTNNQDGAKKKIYYTDDEHEYDYAVTVDDVQYIETVYGEPDAVIVLDGRDALNNKQVLYIKYVGGNIYTCDIFEDGSVKSFYKLSKGKFLRPDGTIDINRIQSENDIKGVLLANGKDYNYENLQSIISSHLNNIPEIFTVNKKEIKRGGVVIAEKKRGKWIFIQGAAEFKKIDGVGIFFEYNNKKYFLNASEKNIFELDDAMHLEKYKLDVNNKDYMDAVINETYLKFYFGGIWFLLSERGNVAAEDDKKVMEGAATMFFANTVYDDVPVLKHFSPDGTYSDQKKNQIYRYFYEIISGRFILHAFIEDEKKNTHKMHTYKLSQGALSKQKEFRCLRNPDTYIIINVIPKDKNGDTLVIKIDSITGEMFLGDAEEPINLIDKASMIRMNEMGIQIYPIINGAEISVVTNQNVDSQNKFDVQIRKITIKAKTGKGGKTMTAGEEKELKNDKDAIQLITPELLNSGKTVKEMAAIAAQQLPAENNDSDSENKNQIASTDGAVKILNKIGNGKFIKWVYGNNINKTGENFRYTVLGVAIGVVLETFSLWTPNFIKSHDNPTMGMKIAVWVIRALSIGIGVTVALNPVTLPFIIPAVILTEWITHFIWNKVQISKGNKDLILQTDKSGGFMSRLKSVIFKSDGSGAIEIESKDGDTTIVLVEMPDGNNYAVEINNNGRYQEMHIIRENDAAVEKTYDNLMESKDIAKLLGIKIQIRDNGRWKDITKKASAYYADRLRVIRIKVNNKSAAVTVVNPRIVDYKPLSEQSVLPGIDENLESIKKETNTTKHRIVYLEDFDSDFEALGNTIRQAIDNHELLVIYPLKHTVNPGELSTEELFNAYNFILHKLGDFSRFMSSFLVLQYGFKTTANYFINEILKNAFMHGNKLNMSAPIYMNFSGQTISVYNAVDPNKESSVRERFLFSATGGTGFKTGIKTMQIDRIKSDDEKKDLILKYVLSGYGDNLDILKYTSNPEVKSEGKTFYKADINITESLQPTGFGVCAQAAGSAVKDSVKLYNVSQKLAVELVLTPADVEKLNNKGLNIKSNLIIVNNRRQAEKFRNQGFNVVNSRIASGKEMKGIKGIIIGEYNGKQIRACLDNVKGEIIFYSNDPELDFANIKTEDLQKLLQQAQVSGVSNELFKDIEQIVIAGDDLTLDALINTIKNTVTDGISKPPVSINLDFTGRKDITPSNIETISRGETNNGIDSNTIIFNIEQLKAMDAEKISALQEKGYEIILESDNISEAEEIMGRLHINGVVIKTGGRITESELRKIKQMADSNVKDRQIIKTQMFVEGLSDETLASLGDIYERYSILPVIAADSLYIQTNRKCSVRITEKDNVLKLFEKSNVVSITADKISTVKKSSGILSDIISDILKPSTPKQKFITELKKSKETEYELKVNNITGILKNKDSALVKLLGRDWFEGEDETANEQNLKDAVNAVLAENILDGFAKSRVEKFMREGRVYEALGCIRACAERTVESMILSKLNSAGVEIVSAKLKKYAGGLLRDAIVITGIQLLMEGKNMETLLKDFFITSDMTAQEYFDSMLMNINGSMKDIVKTNEYGIKPLSDEKAVSEATADFKDFNLLIQDQLRERMPVQSAKISTAFAVRSILGAA